MRPASDWKDYEILDTSDGEKLERWKDILLIRPDPQVIWNTPRDAQWSRANARYLRSSSGGGLFPEQAVNWDYMASRIREAGRPVKVLNLFAYTGGATLACARAGAQVCHVDASKGMVAWARENAALSGLTEKPIRWIVDDCAKFVQREIRRGSRYDGIIMDPPSYGRGPGGEVWKLEEKIYELVELCAQLLSEDALFFLLNSYTTGLSPSVMEYLLGVTVNRRHPGNVSSSEIGLPVTKSGFVLPCGSTAIWSR